MERDFEHFKEAWMAFTSELVVRLVGLECGLQVTFLHTLSFLNNSQFSGNYLPSPFLNLFASTLAVNMRTVS